MSKSEDDLLAAVNKGGAELSKVKAWYRAYPFYAGLIAGAIAARLIPWALGKIL
jgi:hypothetical protein